MSLETARIEPRWPDDGGRRRGEVLLESGRVARFGWCRCLTCRQPHWSEDLAANRLCSECGGAPQQAHAAPRRKVVGSPRAAGRARERPVLAAGRRFESVVTAARSLGTRSDKVRKRILRGEDGYRYLDSA